MNFGETSPLAPRAPVDSTQWVIGSMTNVGQIGDVSYERAEHLPAIDQRLSAEDLLPISAMPARRVLLASALLCLVSPYPASAGTILLSPGGGVFQIDFFEPIGQSFTATDPFVDAALYFQAINSGSPNTDPIRYDLYSGNGTSGALLASSTFSLTTGFVGFVDFDLSATPLMVGNMYTLVASIVGSSPHWGVGTSEFNYIAGQPILNGNPTTLSSPDNEFALRVTPTVAEVPEPATFLLLGLGVAAGGWMRRRARQ